MLRALLVAAAVCMLAPAASACCSGMVMNQAGLNLLENAEGYSATTYVDSTGNPTICYGHKIVPSDNFSPPLSQAQCQAILQNDLAGAQNCVQNAVQVPLNSNQFSALVDFTFNLGCGALQSSTLLRLLNQGQYSAVPAQLNRWVYGGSVVLPGLVTRRRNEGILWNTPVAGGSTQATTAAPAAGGTTAAPAPAPAGTTAAPAPVATTAAPAPVATTAAPPPATTAAPPPPPTTTGSWLAAVANTQTQSSSGLTSTETVLLVVGAVAGVVCLAVGVILMRRRAAREETDAPLIDSI